MRRPCPLALLSSFLLVTPPLLIKAVVFINETETCVSTDEEAMNHLEKSQYRAESDHRTIESYWRCWHIMSHFIKCSWINFTFLLAHIYFDSGGHWFFLWKQILFHSIWRLNCLPILMFLFILRETGENITYEARYLLMFLCCSVKSSDTVKIFPLVNHRFPPPPHLPALHLAWVYDWGKTKTSEICHESLWYIQG